MDAQIRARLADTRRTLLEHFDDDVHQRLRLRLSDTQTQLDRVSQRFWALTHYMLGDRAAFDDAALAFDLHKPPRPDVAPGRYHLISKARPRQAETPTEPQSQYLYRLSHPLGEQVLAQAPTLATPPATLTFDVSRHRPGLPWSRHCAASTAT